MPNYEYYCSNCNKDVEIHCPIQDKDKVRKHKCGCVLLRTFNFLGHIWKKEEKDD